MNAFKLFVAFAFVIACGLAVQAAEPELGEAPAAVSDNARQKRYPFAYPYGYSSYSAYHAPYSYHSYHAPLYSGYHAPYSAYSSYHYPYSYSRSYYGYHAPYYY